MTVGTIVRTVAAGVLIITAVSTASGTALAAGPSSPSAVTTLATASGSASDSESGTVTPDDSGWQGGGS
jgi:hypothetical protein